MDKYAEWIDARYPTQLDAYGQCAVATLQMVAAFPELTRVRGHYYDAYLGEREHWWCTATDGAVVDPTDKQFPTAGRGTYVPLDPNAKEPTGKCLDCGAYVYDNDTFCSTACEQATMSYMRTGQL